MYRRWWFAPLMAVLLGVATMALPALGADKTKVKVKEGSYFTLTCPSGQNAVSGQATYYDKNNQVITTQQGFVRGSEVLFGPAPKKSVYAIAELNCVPVETTTSS